MHFWGDDRKDFSLKKTIFNGVFTASNSAGVKKNRSEILSGTMNMIKKGKNKAA